MRRKDRKIQDNSWNIETTDSGAQNWVRYQKGIINEVKRLENGIMKQV